MIIKSHIYPHSWLHVRRGRQQGRAQRSAGAAESGRPDLISALQTLPTARTLHGGQVNGLRCGTEPRRGYLPPLQLFSAPLLDDKDGLVMGRFHGKPCEILPVHLVEPGILRCPGHLHCRSGVIEIAVVAQTGSHGDTGVVLSLIHI